MLQESVWTFFYRKSFLKSMFVWYKLSVQKTNHRTIKPGLYFHKTLDSGSVISSFWKFFSSGVFILDYKNRGINNHNSSHSTRNVAQLAYSNKKQWFKDMYLFFFTERLVYLGMELEETFFLLLTLEVERCECVWHVPPCSFNNQLPCRNNHSRKVLIYHTLQTLLVCTRIEIWMGLTYKMRCQQEVTKLRNFYHERLSEIRMEV